MNTLTEEQILKEARRLNESESNVEQAKAITFYHPDLSIIDAYRIQDAWVKMKLDAGRKVIGHKIGLTSTVMQRAFSIDEPDFGVLLDDMVFKSGDVLDARKYLDPRIEVEIAFKLKADLNPKGLTIDKVLEATEFIIPAMELIAFRSIAVDPENGHKRTVKDTIADNAANAAIILGEIMIPKDTDLRWVSALLYKNGVIEDSGVAAAVLEHPVNGVIWLAKKYAEFGRTLKAGQIVLAGSFTSPISVKPGDKIVAEFKQFGKIDCSFQE